ncbi:hypothetical protein [Granulicella sp. S156]|uniref:hypothetical protein n=1 Tax=Granulicella sp. S156 TaxID=1747224 RepID=UPI00131C0DF7|nr:hypothetical protein [Granulicella sp. S156]
MLSPEDEAIAERRSRFVGRQLLAFWPMVDDIDDVDRVSLLGYGTCIVYAVWQSIVSVQIVFQSGDADERLAIYLITPCMLIFYFLGANAVRRSSVPAAAFLALAAFAVPFVTYMERRSFHALEIGVFVIFLIVLRGTWLTSKWLSTHTADDVKTGPLRISNILPLQIRTGVGRVMVDAWPARVWPRCQILFWIAGIVMLSAALLGLVMDHLATHIR